MLTLSPLQRPDHPFGATGPHSGIHITKNRLSQREAMDRLSNCDGGRRRGEDGTGTTMLVRFSGLVCDHRTDKEAA